MPDHDRNPEQHPNDTGRSMGVAILAGLSLLGLVGATMVVARRASETSEPPIARDPLAALEADDALRQGHPKDERQNYDVNPVALNFPQTLTGRKERPEVLQALSAAAREVAGLSGIDLDSPDDERMDTAARLSRTMPAAVAAGPARRTLVQQAPHDPMVEAAIPEPQGYPAPAQPGAEGEYTLQVTSFDDPQEAREFAAALRTKGHRAFVATADVPDRGRFYRVRIGPFNDVYEANRYRALFERAEQMNTFVVNRE